MLMFSHFLRTYSYQSKSVVPKLNLTKPNPPQIRHWTAMPLECARETKFGNCCFSGNTVTFTILYSLLFIK